MVTLPRISKAYRFQYIDALQYGIHSRVADINLCIGIFLFQDRFCIQSRLHGAAELGCDTDADDGNSRLDKRKKCIYIILHGRHGRLRIYIRVIHHFLIELTDTDLYHFLLVFPLFKRYIKRNYRNVFFFGQLHGKITGTV